MIGSDVSYKPLIQDFTWSYSRIKCFDSCKWQFFLKYIREYTEDDTFYASFGRFMHEIIEGFYTGRLSKDDMLAEFVLNYREKIVGNPPRNVSRDSYLEKGLNYLKAFKPFQYEMVSVEEKVNFDIDGIPFVGFIDYIGRQGDELYIIDNKSRDLKPRSKRGKPTKNDEILDDMLKQLYLYAHAVKQKYGQFPHALCFNCFKNGQFILEPFREDKYNEAIHWAVNSVHEIEDFTRFYEESEYDYYKCNFLCGLCHDCEIWQDR